MTALTARCHCGRVEITVPGPPDYVNQCNCSLCTKLGWICAYYDPAQVEIIGETVGYVREDIAEPALSTHHCGNCGTTTHWSPLGDLPRMGINAQLLPEGALEGVEIRAIDGRSW